ncbi:MAG: SPOR domain-containing protein [Gammaproteobacteria bacterium]
MERRIKERLTGAAILVMLGVIFIPMILDDSIHTDTTIEETNIPERPQGSFDTRSLSPDEPRQKPEPKPQSKFDTVTEPEPKAEPPASVMMEEETAPAVDAAGEMEKEVEKKKEKTAAPEPVAEEKPEQPEQTTEETDGGADETPPVKKAPAREAKSRGLTAWVVQIGSFSQQDNANKLVKRLQESGYPAFIEPLKQDAGTVYRVRIGPELLRSDANAVKEKLEQELDMEGIVLEYP